MKQFQTIKMMPHSLLTALAVVIGIAIYYFTLAFNLSMGVQPGPSDDTYIVFIYARNFLENFGLYFNVQDGPVDGFTSLLDVFVKCFLYLIDPNRAYLWASISAAFISTLIPVLIFLMLFNRTKVGIDKVILIFGALLFGTHHIIHSLTANPLETPHFVLFGTAYIMAFGLSKPSCSRFDVTLITSLGILWLLARPEAMALMVVAQFAYYLVHRQVHPSVKPTLIFIVGYIAWRYYMFGHWAPNTYYAKRSDYFWNEVLDGYSFLRSHLSNLQITVPLALATAIVSWLIIFRARIVRSDLVCLTFVSGSTAVIGALMTVPSGGDSYVSNPRFLALQVTLSVVCALSFALNFRRLNFLVGLTLLAALGIKLYHGWPMMRWNAPFTIYNDLNVVLSDHYRENQCDAELAAILSSKFPNKKIGQTDFQKLKYMANDLWVIDLHGLNDQEVAHSSFPIQNLWGKFNWSTVTMKDVDLVFVSFDFRQPYSVEGVNPSEVMTNEQLFYKYTGWSFAVSDLAVRNDYTLASIGVCNEYYNFLIKKSLLPEGQDVYVLN
jgi:hypothetical protein